MLIFKPSGMLDKKVIITPLSQDYSIKYWMQKGASAKKLIMGMPLYGQSFTLSSASVNGLNAPALSAGQAGAFTRQPGFLAYYEICDKIKNEDWTVSHQTEMGPYAFKGNQWVSYDDLAVIRRKVRLFKKYFPL